MGRHVSRAPIEKRRQNHGQGYRCRAEKQRYPDHAHAEAHQFFFFDRAPVELHAHRSLAPLVMRPQRKIVSFR